MKFILTILLSIAAALHALGVQTEASPGFFLKITKNIPRLGRSPSSADFEKYMLKTFKNIPRIGRDDEYIVPQPWDKLTRSWNNEIPRPSKKMSDSFNVDQLNGYHLIQPLDANTVYDVLSRDMLASHRFRFVAWKDFDRALEQDSELYEKLLSIGKEANLNLPDDDSKKFIPLFGDPSNNDLIYYRADRDLGAHFADGQMEFE